MGGAGTKASCLFTAFGIAGVKAAGGPLWFANSAGAGRGWLTARAVPAAGAGTGADLVIAGSEGAGITSGATAVGATVDGVGTAGGVGLGRLTGVCGRGGAGFEGSGGAGFEGSGGAGLAARDGAGLAGCEGAGLLTETGRSGLCTPEECGWSATVSLGLGTGGRCVSSRNSISVTCTFGSGGTIKKQARMQQQQIAEKCRR